MYLSAQHIHDAAKSFLIDIADKDIATVKLDKSLREELTFLSLHENNPEYSKISLSVYVIAQCHAMSIDPHHCIAVLECFTDSIKQSDNITPSRRKIDAFLQTRDKLMASDFSQQKLVRRIFLDIIQSIELLSAIYIAISYDWIHDATTLKQFYCVDEPILQFIAVKPLYNFLRDKHLKSTMPAAYQKVRELIGLTLSERHRILQSIVYKIRSQMSDQFGYLDIKYRCKTIYSIIDKMRKKNISFEDIFDKSAIRIIVDTVEDCYKVESIINQMFIPAKPYRKDYIQTPKENGYQSIHTVLHDARLGYVECQIRTTDMHEYANQGHAAHTIYKSKDGQITTIDRTLFDRFINQSQLTKSDVDQYVYTISPLMQVIELPKGSTPIDFAYAIHTDLGNQCCGAIVNGKIVQLHYQLCTGDIVEIIAKKDHTPPRSWLTKDPCHLYSKKAIKKVKQFHNISNIQKYSDGTQKLNDAMKKLGISSHDINKIAIQCNFNNAATLIKFIANKRMSSIEKLLTNGNEKPIKEKSNNTHAINKKELLEVEVAQCCYPTYDDNIIGYVSVKGCHIHREDCRNLANQSARRKLPLAWHDVAVNSVSLRFIIRLRGELDHNVKQYMMDHNILQISSTKNKKIATFMYSITQAPFVVTYSEAEKVCRRHHPGSQIYRVGMRPRKDHSSP